jgi:hypothetical protein
MEAVRLTEGQETTLEKKEMAALLESLCERPFAGDQEGPPPAVAVAASRIAQALSGADAERSEVLTPGQPVAELAAILSGTATEAQCGAFHEAAATSGAARLEAQSALAFVDGIDAAPLAVPAHLVDQVVVDQAGLVAAARSRARVWSGVWSGLSGRFLGRRGGQVVAACAVMLMAAGLSWSMLRPTADTTADLAPPRSVEPVVTAPKEVSTVDSAPPIGAVGPAPAVAPAAAPGLSLPEPKPVTPVRVAPPPAEVQALVDPCTPRLAKSEAQASSDVRFRVVRPEPKRPAKTADLAAPDPGCGVDTGSRLVVNPAAEGTAGGNPRADRGPVRTERPAAQAGRSDRVPAAAAASTPAAAPYPAAARPASPGPRPSSVQSR